MSENNYFTALANINVNDKTDDFPIQQQVIPADIGPLFQVGPADFLLHLDQFRDGLLSPGQQGGFITLVQGLLFLPCQLAAE